MPRLENISANTETIRTYFSFYVSKYEIMRGKFDRQGDFNTDGMIQRYIRKGVADLCLKCTQQGYYIVGLERGGLINEAPPDLAKDWRQQDVIPYSVMLDLFVRRFVDQLTTDELYYWSEKSTERILFELDQLQAREVRPLNMYSNSEPIFKGEVAKFTGIDFASSRPDKTNTERGVTTENLEKLKRLMDTFTSKYEADFSKIILPAIVQESKKMEAPVRRQYNIIRRPKCSSGRG